MNSLPFHRWLAACAGICVLPPVGRAAALTDLPAYAPRAVVPPSQAGYLRPNGAIRIVGLADLSGIVGRIDVVFRRYHPGFKFSFSGGDDLSALYCLAFDSAALAPIGTPFLSGASGPYSILVGAKPFGIRIAHASLTPGAAVSPIGVVVNPANPLAQLTVDQVSRIFTTGGRATDLTHWGQIGMTGAWASAEIHPCGLPPTDHYPSEDTTFGECMFERRLGGQPWPPSYRMVRTYDGVVRHVAADPRAIGLVALNHVTSGVRVVGIAGTWGPPSRGSAADIRADRYPFDRYLWIYVRRPAGRPLDPFIREYLRLVLSREGQESISGARGYIPLNAREVASELAKLQ